MKNKVLVIAALLTVAVSATAQVAIGPNVQIGGVGSGGSGVSSINLVAGAFTFTGSGVTCSSTTCTFTGASLTLTTSGTSGAATYSGGVLNIPQYQGALTLTTTGTSGAATLSGNTLNIPQYSGGGNVMDGSGTTTAPLWAQSTSTAHTITYSNAMGAHSAFGVGATVDGGPTTEPGGDAFSGLVVQNVQETSTAAGLEGGVYVGMNFNPSTTPTGLGYGTYFVANAEGANWASSYGIAGSGNHGVYSGTGTGANALPQVAGATAESFNLSTGEVTNAYGVYGSVANGSSQTVTDGKIDTARGGHFQVANLGDGTITNAEALYTQVWAENGAATMTNVYGGYFDSPGIASPDTATNVYGIYLADQSGVNGATSTYQLYSAGTTAPFYIAGPLRANGTITFPGIESASGEDCVQVSSSGVLSNTGAACGSGSGGSVVQVNSSTLATANLASTTGATGVTVSNPSGSTVNFNLATDTLTLGSTTLTLGGTTTSVGGLTLASPTFSGTVAGANTVPLSILAQSGANTMLGNWTGSTANVTANAMPSCSAGGDALLYTSGTGVTCATGYATGTITSKAAYDAAYYSAATTINGAAITGFQYDSTSAAPAAATAANLGSLADIAQYDVVVSGGTAAALTGVAPGTSGYVLTSNGASAAPSFQAVTAGTLTFPATVAGTTTSGGIPYFSSTTALTSSGLLAAGHVLLGGGAGSAPTSDSSLDDSQTTANTLTYAGTGGIAAPSFTSSGSTHGLVIPAGTAVSGASGEVIYASDATNGYAEVNENNTGLSRICTAANGVCTGSGTVTSVGQTFTGGLISVSGSPITTSGTLALTVAGTSGGVPYFSSSSAWASSAALPSGDFVLGGGAGSAPTATFSVVTAAKGGTGVANTATLTLGTSNQNWASLGTGIVKNTTTTGALTDAAASDVISLWSGTCSSSTYLNGAGACASPSGSGTVGSGTTGQTGVYTGSGTAIAGDNLPLDVSQFSGSDIGAKINAAYAALPSGGGSLSIPFGSYSFSTPIVLSTSGKFVVIYGNGATLAYTGTTGSAITSDISAGYGDAFILHDLTISTSVSAATTTGFTAGDSSAQNSFYGKLDNVSITGFKVLVMDYAYGLEAKNLHLQNCSSASGSVGFETADDADDTHITGGWILACGTNLEITNYNPVFVTNMLMGTATTVDISLTDYGELHCTNCHLLNSSGTASFLSSEGYVFFDNSDFEDDASTGSTTAPLTSSYGTVSISNSQIYSAGETYTEFVDFTGTQAGGTFSGLAVQYTGTFTLYNASATTAVSVTTQGIATGAGTQVASNIGTVTAAGIALGSGGSTSNCWNTAGTTTACSGGSSGLTVGSTTVSSGTNAYLLYNNSGVLGNEAASSVAFTTGTLSLAGNLSTSGAYAVGLTFPGAYTYTFPGATQSLAGLSSAQTWAAAQTFPTSDILIKGSSTGTTALASANSSSTSYTATLPAATDTVVELTQTQTLTNKTLTSPTLTTPALGTPASGVITNVTGTCTSCSVDGNAATATAGQTRTTFTTSTSAVAANTCASTVTVAMTGASSSSVFLITPTASTAAVTGWGSTGGLVLTTWGTSGDFQYQICNQTASSITPGAVTFNVIVF